MHLSNFDFVALESDVVAIEVSGNQKKRGRISGRKLKQHREEEGPLSALSHTTFLKNRTIQ